MVIEESFLSKIRNKPRYLSGVLSVESFIYKYNFFNRYRAIQVIDFFLVEFVVYIFQIICLFHLIYLIYWHKLLVILFYYSLHIFRLCGGMTSLWYWKIMSLFFRWSIWLKAIHFIDILREPAFDFIDFLYCVFVLYFIACRYILFSFFFLCYI